MASGFTNKALYDIARGAIDLDTDALKVMLVKTTYTFDKDHTFVDDGSSNDPLSHEIVATNYVGGFGGAGRKAATVTGNANNTDNRGDFAIADQTWVALGGATNDVIGGAVLFKEVTNDGLSPIVAFFDLVDTPSNGSDISLDYLSLIAGGNLRFSA